MAEELVKMIKLNMEQREEMAQLRSRGHSLSDIGKKFGVKKATVAYILKSMSKNTKPSASTGGFEAAQAAVPEPAKEEKKEVEAAKDQTVQIGSVDGLVATAEAATAIFCKVYCAVNAIRLEPEIERQLQFSNQEREALKNWAPFVLPYMPVLKENSPMIGVVIFGATFLGMQVQRLAVMKTYKKIETKTEKDVEASQLVRTVVPMEVDQNGPVPPQQIPLDSKDPAHFFPPGTPTAPPAMPEAEVEQLTRFPQL